MLVALLVTVVSRMPLVKYQIPASYHNISLYLNIWHRFSSQYQLNVLNMNLNENIFLKLFRDVESVWQSDLKFKAFIKGFLLKQETHATFSGKQQRRFCVKQYKHNTGRCHDFQQLKVFLLNKAFLHKHTMGTLDVKGRDGWMISLPFKTRQMTLIHIHCEHPFSLCLIALSLHCPQKKQQSFDCMHCF